MRFDSKQSLLLLAGCVSAAAMTFNPVVRAQAPTAPNAPAVVKPMAFDVVSIRENHNESSGAAPVYGPTPNGYRMDRLPLPLIFIAAYVPSGGDGTAFFNPRDIEGMPDWLLRTRYDVEARVAESDMKAWQDPTQQPALMRTMLQKMLEDRLKLTVHRENREKPVFELRVAKSGIKMKASAASDLSKVREAHPKAGQLPGGMILVEGENHGLMVYNATMQSLGVLLSGMVERPIVDKTGLTGRYDIDLVLDTAPGPNGEQPDRASALIFAMQDQLGLKLEAAKTSVEALVIDHVEKPSEN